MLFHATHRYALKRRTSLTSFVCVFWGCATVVCQMFVTQSATPQNKAPFSPCVAPLRRRHGSRPFSRGAPSPRTLRSGNKHSNSNKGYARAINCPLVSVSVFCPLACYGKTQRALVPTLARARSRHNSLPVVPCLRLPPRRPFSRLPLQWGGGAPLGVVLPSAKPPPSNKKRGARHPFFCPFPPSVPLSPWEKGETDLGTYCHLTTRLQSAILKNGPRDICLSLSPR